MKLQMEHIKIDERNHVEKPLLDQLSTFGWEILDLDNKQHTADTFRSNFNEVIMLSVLRGQFIKINAWLEGDQVEKVVKRLTASFPGSLRATKTSLIQDLLIGDVRVAPILEKSETNT